MRSTSPLLLLTFLHAFTSLLVTAEVEYQCLFSTVCDIDVPKMRQAIELIPSPSLIPSDDQPQHALPNPNAYKLPAIFETHTSAQILVRVTSAMGMELDAQTRMTNLWPHAKQTAVTLLDKCNAQNPGLHGRAIVKLEWQGPPYRRLGYQLDMSCQIIKKYLPGVTTYTPTGVESGRRLGEGSSIPHWGGL